MGYNFRAYDPDQLFLLSPSLDEWLPKDHLARFIDESVELMELTDFYKRYRKDGAGNSAYHPKMMVKLMLYGYCEGITSSRTIAKACENQVSFRYLSTNQLPGFRTIARFRRDHTETLKALFVEALLMCKKAGMVKMGKVALDGTKLKANAALESNRELAWIEKEVDRLLAAAEAVDAEEDAQYGEDRRGDEVPEELQQKKPRLERLMKAKEKLEQEKKEALEEREEKLKRRAEEEKESGQKKRGRKPDKAVVAKEPKINLTDEDSRIMKTRQGYVQGYNAQAVVDCETQIIVGQAVTQECNDRQQLWPMIEIMEEQSGETAEVILADAGYCSEANLALETEATELFVAVNKEWKTKKAQREEGGPRGRIPSGLTSTQLMERKLLTQRGRKYYRIRGKTVEPVFGQIKTCRGLTALRLRGKNGADLEWSLCCTTHNLLKLWRWGLKNASKN